MNIADRVRIAGHRAVDARRALVAGAMASPIMRWRYGAGATGEILIVPRDLRPADPSFYTEVRIGQWGLAGSDVWVGEGCPFDVPDVSRPFERELHGFGWLRHLAACDEPEAHDLARELVFEWLARRRTVSGCAREADVSARRLMSWLSHADLILEGATPARFDTLLQAFDRDLSRLAATWRAAPEGACRIIGIAAVVLGQLALSGHERQLPDSTRLLCEELQTQVIAPSGHASRNPAVMVELLLDLLPLAQCFVARSHEAPANLVVANEILLGTLRHLRLGDGGLARFNGLGPAPQAELGTVLGHDETGAIGAPPRDEMVRNGYARLASGRSVLIVDAAPPPPLAMSAEAHAGCLSFEWSYGRDLVFVNGGAPSVSAVERRAAARSTASHNTLHLAECASSELLREHPLESRLGAPPLRYPDRVDMKTLLPQGPDARPSLQFCHDGYVARFGLVHQRRLSLEDDGRTLSGVDVLVGREGAMRLPHDLPFAIHFHLPRRAEARCLPGTHRALVELASGLSVIFEAEGAQVSVEPGWHFAMPARPAETSQLVLRGSTFGESEIRWTARVVAVCAGNSG